MSQNRDPLKSLLEVQRHMIKKAVPDAPKLYFLHENKSDCVLCCSLLSVLFFVGDKIADYN